MRNAFLTALLNEMERKIGPSFKKTKAKIYQKDKATLLSCKSALKIVTTEQKNGRTITKTYETPMYTPWYYFTNTPLTAREIFEKDANLKDSGLFETFEKLDASITFTCLVKEGEVCKKGTIMAKAQGKLLPCSPGNGLH